jgi:hypothetical protein
MGAVVKPNFNAPRAVVNTPPTVQAAPEIHEGEPSDMMLSMLVQGDSGTGKTHGIYSLIEAGYNVLVVAVEAKVGRLLSKRPKVVYIDGPVEDRATGAKRPPTINEKFERLVAFKEALANGKYREHNGRAIDIICGDGIMEVMDVMKAYRLKNMPVAKTTGEQNTFRAYDLIGQDGVDFVKGIKVAASEVCKQYGMEPVGQYWTVGEEYENGSGRFIPILPGKIAPRALPYQFEVTLRLAVEQGQYLAHTVAGAQWAAKCPPNIFEQTVNNPNIGEMWGKLMAYYRGEGQ